MTIQIEDPEVERQLRAIAERTGQTVSQVVLAALREHMTREDDRAQGVERTVTEAMAIGRHCATLPVLDPRAPDELLGYDERGLPS